MTTIKNESNHGVTPVEYIRWLFEPSDHLAVLVRNRDRGDTTQRIATAENIAGDAFQQWLHWKNEKQSADVFVGMNPLKPNARTRTKENIDSIRHLYLDLDHDADRCLAALEHSRLVPSPNAVISTSPGKFQIVWPVEGFAQEQAEAVLRAMARKFDGDLAATDSTRVLRLPGFLNRKYETEFRVNVEIRSEERHTPHQFHLRTDPSELDQRPTRFAGNRQAASTRPPLSQSEHDWAYAKRSLAKGVAPQEVMRQIAAFRSHDKHDPKSYARRTVEKASSQLLEAKYHSESGSQTGFPQDRE